MLYDEICGFEKDVPSKRVTPFAGGIINRLYFPESVDEAASLLSAFRAENVSFAVLGGGKNTLIKGRINRAVCLKKMNPVTTDDAAITAYAGAPLSSVVRAAYENSMTGAEALTGIPGTVGGAVRMNAGAFGTEICGIVDSIEVLTPTALTAAKNSEEGGAETLGTVDNATVQNTPVDAVIDGSPCEINLLNSYSAVYVKPEYGYRHCDFRGDLIVSVRFVLERGDRSAIGKRMDYVFSERLKRHPNEPSLGSVWKAVDSVPAAVYIEKLLLKGMRAGGVMLSPKHCNFIVNVGGGTSYDYIKLMEIVETVALEKLGVKLEREIRVLEE